MTMSDQVDRQSIVWADEWEAEGLPAPVLDVVGDLYTFGQMTVQCQDGSFWRNIDVWHSRHWEQYVPYPMTDEPVGIPPPYIPPIQ